MSALQSLRAPGPPAARAGRRAKWGNRASSRALPVSPMSPVLQGRVLLDLALMGVLTVVTFVVLMLVMDQVADTTRRMQTLRGTLTPNVQADYSTTNDLRVAPQRTDASLSQARR